MFHFICFLIRTKHIKQKKNASHWNNILELQETNHEADEEKMQHNQEIKKLKKKKKKKKINFKKN